MTNHEDVAEFHHIALRKYPQKKKGLLSAEEMAFRIKCLREEIDEMEDAYRNGDFAGVIDATIDLVYFAHGQAFLMGIDWEAHWREVHRANMRKRLGITKRDFSEDAVKPEGWTPPDHNRILEQRCRFCNRHIDIWLQLCSAEKVIYCKL